MVRRAEELTRLITELERSNSELDAFAFTTSHDMKEPLRGIHNYATFLIEDYGDVLDAEGVSRLHSLVWLSQRMEDLIESMLQFSRLGRAQLTYEEVDVDRAVREMLDAHSTLLDENHVKVSVPRPLPTIRCDRVQLGQLLGNLVTNAVKYNDKAEKTIEIGFNESPPADDGSTTERLRRSSTSETTALESPRSITRRSSGFSSVCTVATSSGAGPAPG